MFMIKRHNSVRKSFLLQKNIETSIEGLVDRCASIAPLCEAIGEMCLRDAADASNRKTLIMKLNAIIKFRCRTLHYEHFIMIC